MFLARSFPWCLRHAFSALCSEPDQRVWERYDVQRQNATRGFWWTRLPTQLVRVTSTWMYGYTIHKKHRQRISTRKSLLGSSKLPAQHADNPLYPANIRPVLQKVRPLCALHTNKGCAQRMSSWTPVSRCRIPLVLSSSILSLFATSLHTNPYVSQTSTSWHALWFYIWKRKAEVLF